MSGAALSGVAVITGGASGIGAACCRELAARGARIGEKIANKRAGRPGGAPLSCSHQFGLPLQRF